MSKTGRAFLIVALVLLLPFLGVLYADGIREAFMRLRPARPGPDREIVIRMEDFRFSPSVIRVKAGERVRLRFINAGRHTHEFMLSNNIVIEEGVTEIALPDFFEGMAEEDVHVEVVQGVAMPMFELGHEEGEGQGEGAMAMEGEKDKGMDMGADMDMGMGEGEIMRASVGPGYHAEGMVMNEVHGGNMIMMDPGAEVVLEFTVPKDKTGTWIFGCFQEDGLHFDAGMRGLLIVEP